MGITKKQMPKEFIDIIEEERGLYEEGTSVTTQNDIPDTDKIPLDKPRLWLRIPDVICVYVDMMNSTQLSATKHDKSTAAVYRFYTHTAVRIFHEFESPYIDVRGDGVFALFNKNQPYRALAAAVTFKTFAKEVFVPTVNDSTECDIGSHMGIDQKTVLVRRMGLRRASGRTDRQNEVWAGKPVSMAAKLGSLTADSELLISDRYFKNLKDSLATKSCGCPSGKQVDLWEEVDVSEDDRLDFDRAYVLKSVWCGTHGKEYCEAIRDLDGD